jgi:RHS repeat-associated protein
LLQTALDSGNRTSKTNYLNETTSNYGYDAIYELLSATGGTTENYTYDVVGNRLSSTGISQYNYNASNELASDSNGSYTYDNNGNTLSDASGKSYTWDFDNRMVSSVVPATGTVTFKYDPFGRRIYKSSPNFTGIFAYDGFNLIQTMNSGGTVVSRYTLTQNIDEPLAEVRSGANSYYEADGLGSITSLSSSTGSVMNTYTYDSFGNVTNSTGTLGNPFSYTGREFDGQTGLYFNRARYYDSTAGRFLSEDPIRFFGRVDFYSYVSNGSTNFSDPSGLCPAANNEKLTTEQCHAAQILLAREAKYGTAIAALMSSIGFGDNTIRSFNSTNTAPIDTPLGKIKIDWHTDIQASGGPSFASSGDPGGIGYTIAAYVTGKLVWTGIRKYYHAPVTNHYPFTDPAERNTFLQTLNPLGNSYSDIFTPTFMMANCQ